MKKNAIIRAESAVAFRGPAYDARNVFLFDPDQPHKDAEQIYREMGGQMLDPYAVNHNCPMCDRTMAWDLFRAHLMPCYRANRLTRIDITKRKFAGASIEGGKDAKPTAYG